MKSSILLFTIAAATLTSCSSVYRSAQTPDDIYYSPSREADAYVQTDKNDGKDNYMSVDNNKPGRRYQSNDYYDNSEDRWLRMRVRNPYRWSAFDDYGYNSWGLNGYGMGGYSYLGSYSPYGGYGVGLGWNNYWNSYWNWNSGYNPYWSGVVIVNPKTNPNIYNKVRNFSLNSYSNNTYSNSNARPTNRAGIRPMSSGSYYNNNNSNSSGLGTSIRRVFSGSSNNNSNAGRSRDSYYTPSSSERPVRSYSPSSSSSNTPSTTTSSSSSSGSSSSGSSGGGTGSRPGRGN